MIEGCATAGPVPTLVRTADPTSGSGDREGAAMSAPTTVRSDEDIQRDVLES